MRSGAEDPHLVDVELVEDTPVPRLARGRRAPRRTPRSVARADADVRDRVRDRPSHGRLWTAVGALAVIVLAGWGLNQAEVRQDASRLEALAGLPGYLDPIAGPLEVVWRADAGRPVARTATALLLADDTHVGQGAGAVSAVDLVTGRELWRRVVSGEACRALPTAAGPELPRASVVVCLPLVGMEVPASRVVTVLDAVTGEEARTLTAEAAIAVELVGDLVVLTSAATGGGVTVRAWDPASGVDAWAFTGGADGPAALSETSGWSHERGTGTVTFRSGDVRVTFDTLTGRRLPVTATGTPDVETVDLPGGREARWGHDRFGRPKDVVIVDRDGGTRFRAPGVPWLAPVRDGSVNEVVVIRRTVDQHLLGLDAGAGRVRWDLANVPWLEPAVQVGGVVVAATPSSVVALDVGTGLRLWDHDAARGPAAWDVLTDGRVVLVPTDDAERGLVLAARRLQTGDEAWDVPLPSDVLAIDEVDGETVLVLTESGLLALR